jgi:hypothetical protein
VDAGPWAPCATGGPWGYRGVYAGGFADRPLLAIRATDSAGRTAMLKGRPNSFAATVGAPPMSTPAVGVGSSGVQPSDPLRGRLFQAPRARWAVGRHGTRVRSLSFRWLPRGTSIALRCRGHGCPVARAATTTRRAGAYRVTRLLGRRHRLRPGAVLTVTVRAPRRLTRTFRWTIRARRAPRLRSS